MRRFVFFFALLINTACAFATTPLIPGDPLGCFTRVEGSVSVTASTVTGMPFQTSVRLKTGEIPPTANAWDYRLRCFTTAASAKDDTVVASFWIRAVSGSDGKALTSFVQEKNVSPYTKSLSSIAVAGPGWKRFQIPFSLGGTCTGDD